MHFTYYSLPSLLTCFCVAAPFAFFIRNRPLSHQQKLFGFILIQLFIYMGAQFFLINSASEAGALFFDKLIYAAVSFTPAAYFHLILAYNRKQPLPKFFLVLLYFPAPIFIGLLFTDLLIAGVQTEYWGYGKVEGPLFYLFRIYLMLYTVISIAILSKMIVSIEKASRERNGLFWVWLSYILPMTVTLVVTIILQSMGINRFNIIFHDFAIIAGSSCLSYAMKKYPIFDLELLIGRVTKNKRHRFYERLKYVSATIAGIGTYAGLGEILHRLLGCEVALNVDSRPVAATGGSKGFQEYTLDDELAHRIMSARGPGGKEDKCCPIFMQGALEKGFDFMYQPLRQNQIEAMAPLLCGGKLIGLVKFGYGFSTKIYSKQDFDLISLLCKNLITAINHIMALDREVNKLKLQLAEREAIINERDEEIAAMKRPAQHGTFRSSSPVKHYINAIRFESPFNKHVLISDSPLILELIVKIIRVAKVGDPILLLGETGTGKELMAELIRYHAQKKPFISINCASYPQDLLASNLFGHEKGAYTGAHRKRSGLIEEARGGIIFLDEIGELGEETQATLLRVLEGHPYKVLGGTHLVTPDVQFIAATNKDIKKDMVRGIRPDIFYRFKRFYLPNLQERKEDIPLLAHYFLDKFNEKYDKSCELSDAYIEGLKQFSWPGNVRELSDFIEDAIMTAQKTGFISFPEKPKQKPSTLNIDLSDPEIDELLSLLQRHDFSQRMAAKELGIAFSSLNRRLRRKGLTYKQLLSVLAASKGT